MDDKERITLLEERYAHLQRHVVQQDKAMLKLSEEFAKLRQEISLLRTRDAGGSQTGELPDERPPHY
jgi:cell division protein FtsB